MSSARSNPSTSSRRELCRLCRLGTCAASMLWLPYARLALQAPGRCRGSSRVVLKAAPGIGDQRRVLLKPLRKTIFVVRSRNSRRSSVGAGPPIVSLKTIKIQRFRCHFVMVWTETIFRNLPRSGRAPLVPFGFPWPLGPLPLALWVPLGPLGGWGGGGVPGVPLGPRDRHLVEARKGRLES